MFFARIAYTVGLVLATLAIAMAGPLLTALAEGARLTAASYAIGAGAAMFAAGGLLIISRGWRVGGDMREATTALVLLWLACPVFAALPIWLDGAPLYDAYFEAMSAFTTTGALISPDLSRATLAGVLWRAELQWIGGFITIIFATAIVSRPEVLGALVPYPAAARGESSSILQVARGAIRRFLGVYILLSVIAWVLFLIAGAPFFDSLCLAMSAISTAGFVPAQGGLSAYGSPALTSLTLLTATAGAMNFTLHMEALTRRRANYVRDREEATFFVAFFLLAGLTLAAAPPAAPGDLARAAAAVAGALTTSGFGLESASAPLAIMIGGALIGGSALSTAGGLKLARVFLFVSAARDELWRLAHPRGVLRHRPYYETVGFGVWIFFIGFMLTLAAVTLTVALFGHDFEIALTAAVSLLTNTGPLLAMVQEGEAHYEIFQPSLRLLMAVVMALGRLEAVAAFLFFHRAFWRT